jgi:hypothetical protein
MDSIKYHGDTENYVMDTILYNLEKRSPSPSGTEKLYIAIIPNFIDE